MIDNHSRRSLLASMGAAGFTGLAGCVGGEGNDSVVMRFAPEGQDLFAAGQGMATTINDDQDEIQVEARPTSGGIQTIGLLATGEADFGYIDLYTANRLHNEEGQFADDPIDIELTQVCKLLMTKAVWSTHEDTGINTMEDVEGERIAVGDSAGGFHDYLMEHLEILFDTEDDLTPVEVPITQEASAMNDGQVDAITNTRMNVNAPAYEQEEYSVFQNSYRIVTWPEEAISEIQEDQALAGSYHSPDDLESLDGRDRPLGWGDRDEIWWMEQVFVLVVRPEFDADTLSTMLHTIYDNGDALSERHHLLADMAGEDRSFEFWAEDLAEWLPVHEGAQAFYDDIGLR